ncbi:MAG TPA: sugar nucleotide-binding protein, partial [Novosphingobium sp.]|nr:sugar nucleotide-binding protein [Novosphingobium sp.]
MNVLITGANGLVARALAASVPAGVRVTGLTRQDLDICDAERVLQVVAGMQPDAVINAAAYTACDRAE